MAEVTINPNLRERKWLTDDYLTPYIRMSGFMPYMGRGSNAIIRIFAENKTDGGKDIVVPLVGLIRGEGVSGSQVLEGNEDDMDTGADVIQTNWRRNAVKVPKSNSYKTNLDILNIAKPRLREWAATMVLKRGLVRQIQGIVVPGTSYTEDDGTQVTNPDIVKPYAQATASERNAFVTNNADRILFGIDIANASSGVMATALANVDNTNDKLTPAAISKVKRIAQETASINATTTSPSGPISPYTTDNGEEWYVYWAHPRSMRDLRNDATMTQANRDAMERGKDNPLFKGGDLMWDGVIIKEMYDLDLIAGAGASSIDVAHNVLVGQSALGVAWGQEPRLIVDTKQDYGFRPATAVEELIGIKKLSYSGKQYGAVSHFVAAAADS